jgi:hypothetical protein
MSINPNFEFDKYGIDPQANITPGEILEHVNGIIQPFPVDVFPLPIQKIITATNENLNFPVDFIGVSLLFAASVVTGNTYCIELKNGFRQTAVLYIAIVARPGTNKSHPLSFALKPIVEHDKKTFAEYQEKLKDYKRQMAEYKKQKNKNEEPMEEPKKPIWKKFLLTDFTPEALAEVHSYNQRGVGVYVDELASWFKNFNRYNKSSEMEFWLSQWSGKPINIDRKTSDSIFIATPFISVAGTIQKGILDELAKDRRTQNGFIDRILFCMPDNIQKDYWGETDLPEVFEHNWGRIISNIININLETDDENNPVPVVLNLTPEAKREIFEWQKKNTNQCNELESEVLSGVFSKMDMYVLRLALILEILSYASHESDLKAVSINSVKGAIKLVEYFKKSAVRVNSILSSNNPLDKYPADKRALYNSLPDTFTTEVGLKIAESLGITERTFKRFLSDKSLFNRISWGEYQKIIHSGTNGTNGTFQ